jgi:hypothetical protein
MSILEIMTISTISVDNSVENIPAPPAKRSQSWHFNSLPKK